mmetsp:Transcript_64925/g.184354  ORF Transcript_64925/g.184354 Transcript_64925/m.184354 type:complete len:233 (-) Transcript_64925:909-1607(-)
MSKGATALSCGLGTKSIGFALFAASFSSKASWLSSRFWLRVRDMQPAWKRWVRSPVGGCPPCGYTSCCCELIRGRASSDASVGASSAAPSGSSALPCSQGARPVQLEHGAREGPTFAGSEAGRGFCGSAWALLRSPPDPCSPSAPGAGLLLEFSCTSFGDFSPSLPGSGIRFGLFGLRFRSAAGGLQPTTCTTSPTSRRTALSSSGQGMDITRPSPGTFRGAGRSMSSTASE